MLVRHAASQHQSAIIGERTYGIKAGLPTISQSELTRLGLLGALMVLLYLSSRGGHASPLKDSVPFRFCLAWEPPVGTGKTPWRQRRARSCDPLLWHLCSRGVQALVFICVQAWVKVIQFFAPVCMRPPRGLVWVVQSLHQQTACFLFFSISFKCPASRVFLLRQCSTAAGWSFFVSFFCHQMIGIPRNSE